MAKNQAPQADEVDQLLALNKTAGTSSGGGRSGSAVEAFVREVRPIAEAASRELGVDPSYLIGQWGLETGWGKSVIPGTNNYGNIKDFRGGGKSAKDNMTGSVDKYRAYGSPEDFAKDYAQLLRGQRYSSAMGSKDAQSFFSALKAGGYAEDPNYVRSGVRAAEMARNAMGGSSSGASLYPSRGEYIGGTEQVMRDTERQAVSDESPVSTSLERGWEGLKHNAGLFMDNLADDSEGAAERIKAKREWDAANPAPSSSTKFLKHWQDLAEDDYMGMLGSVLSNPGGMVNQLVEQTPNSLPGLALQVPVALATTGLIASGWGAPIAIGLQGLASFVGNVLPEGGSVIEERLAKAGVDPNNTQAVARWISENRGANLEAGVKKAGVISAVDGATGYLVGKLIAGPSARFAQAEAKVFADAGVDVSNKAARDAARATPAYKAAMAEPAKELLAATTTAQKVARHAGGFAAETVGEGVGEYGGSYAANGEASVKDAVLESLMGAGTSAAMTGAGSVMGAMKAPEMARADLQALAATPVQPAIEANSPLSNMASIGQAEMANAAQAAGTPHVDATAQSGEAVAASEGGSQEDSFSSLFAARDAAEAKMRGLRDMLEQANPDSVEFQDLRGRFQAATAERDNLNRRIQAATAFGAANPSASPAEPSTDPLAGEVESLRHLVEDKAFIQALRSDPRYGKESVTELLAAWAKVRNPGLDQKVRLSALENLKAFAASFEGPSALNPRGQSEREYTPSNTQVATANPSAVGPSIRRDDGRTLDGEIITRPDAMAGANPNQLAAPPVLGLPTEEALAAKRQADADYDQAFQDLLKAEQLGATESELAEYQRTLMEAERLRNELAAQLSDTDARVSDAQRREAEARRREILARVIEEGISGVNPVADVSNRFAAELRRQGYQNTDPTEAEAQSILRAVDVANAREDGPLPSLPNEADFYEPPKPPRAIAPKAEPKPKQQPARKLTPLEIRKYIAAGAVLNGDTLTLPDGTTIKLKGPQIAAAREAIRKAGPAQVEIAPVEASDSVVSEQGAKPQEVETADAASESEPSRSTDEPVAEDLAGEKIDSEWTAFAPETGTLGIPRDQMPQIKAEHRGAMTNFMNARGVDHRSEEVPAEILRPTQAEFSPEKVKKAMDFDGGDRSILVSSDGYVLDGHHQWLAKRETGDPIKVIRLDAPIAQLVPLALEFPSSTTAGDEKDAKGGPITSTPFATFDQGASALKIIGDPTAIRERLANAGIKHLPRKDGAAIPQKDAQEAARRIIPVRIDTYRVEGVPARLADVSLEVMESGDVALVSPAVTARYPSVEAALQDYADSYKDAPENAEDPVHQDPGQPAEAVTPAVVAESVQKSARNTDMNIKEAKAYLLAEIDRAIAEVPAENSELAQELEREKARKFAPDPVTKRSPLTVLHQAEASFEALKNDRIAKTAAQIGFVTFDVPGDGKFKVVNTVEGLAAFRKKVEKSPGFSRPTAPRNSGPTLAGGPTLDESIADAKKFGGNVLAEIGNAIEISRLRGKEDDALLDRFKENSGGKSYDEWLAELDAADEIAARESAEREDRAKAAEALDTEAIFSGLASRGLAKTRAKQAAASHPQAEQIAYVQENFHDILIQLMDAGKLEVNGSKTVTEENKTCL